METARPSLETPVRRVNSSIQGLRGAAALTVMLHHLHYMSARAGFTTECSLPWAQQIGPYAVLLFFCISGYLIIGALHKHGSVRQFAINRLFRIYPLFLILHLVMFLLGPALNYEWMGELRGHLWSYVGHFVSNILFLPGIFNLPIAQKNAWSLSYEAVFYLLTAALFIGWRDWRSLRGKVVFVMGAALCIFVSLLDPRLCFFAIGALVWWLEKRCSFTWPPLGPSSIIACGLGFMAYCSGHIGLTALAVLPFFMDVTRQSGWMSAILSTRFMKWLGKISYSLYLVHPFVLDPLRHLGARFSEGLPPGACHTLFVALGAISALIAAAVSYEIIEVHLTRRLLRGIGPRV